VSNLRIAVACACLATACGRDDGDPSNMMAGAGQGGVGGPSGGSGVVSGSSTVGGSAGGLAGASSGGGLGSQAGAGGQLNGEQLKEAAYNECEHYCARATAACPTISMSVCIGTCHQQADNFAATGECALDHYTVLRCVNDTTMVANITCTSSGWEYDRCDAELATYNACVGLGQ